MMFIVLAAWAVTDFAGFKAIFTNGFETVAFLKMLIVPLTLITLFALHTGLYVSSRTYFFDTLDDDPNTDSTIFLPLLITALLIFGSREGNKTLMEGWGHKAEIASTAEVDQRRNEALTLAERTYQNQALAITETSAAKEKAVRNSYNNQIKAQERIAANTGHDWKKALARKEITRLKSERDAQLDSIALGTATLLEKLGQENMAEVARIKEQHQELETGILSGNKLERSREEASELFARRFSWVFAVGFAALFWLIMWRYVAISVKSGILPKHTFSDTSTRGGVLNWYSLALKDIFTRQSIRVAVWIHRQGIAGTEELKDFNDEYVFTKKKVASTPTPPPYLNGHHKELNGKIPAMDEPGKN